MKNLTLLIVLAFFIQSTATSQSCLPQGIRFTTQEQIDNFQYDYPNCNNIIGTVRLDGDQITNVNGLINITSIEGSLYLGGMTYLPTSLTNLKGLMNLEVIRGNLYVDNCTSLVDFTGLEKLISIGGNLQIGDNWSKSTKGTNGNCVVTHLFGLDNLQSVEGSVYIMDNHSLKSLGGLENLTWVGGDVIIDENRNLKNLDPLQNLTYVNGDIEISRNRRLECIKGISNIDPENINKLRIGSNPSLTFCEADFICSYLSNSEDVVSIFDNAIGCYNGADVMKACGFSTSIDTIQIETSFSAFPNPLISSTTIIFELQQPATVQLIINDYIGKKIMVNEYFLTEGKNEIIWDASGLPYGVYFCTIKTGNKFETMKLLKLR